LLTFFEDSKRRLWVGTNNGVSRFDRATNAFTSYVVNGKNLEPKADSCFDIKEGRAIPKSGGRPTNPCACLSKPLRGNSAELKGILVCSLFVF
jgi:hypothetical protein